MPNITKELALKIASKLEADIRKRRNKTHDIALIYFDEKLIAQFGIRRGSKKDLGHDHIPSQVFLSPNQTKQLGRCPLLREDWINILREKGRL